MQIATIETIECPSVEQFRINFEQRRKPVVIKGALGSWGALEKWNTAYLRAKIGDAVVPVRVKPESAPPGYFAGDPKARLPLKKMRVAEYIELFESRRSTDVYMAGTSIPDFLPALQEDVPSLPYIGSNIKYKKQFWLGIQGTVTPLHLDIWDNFLCQIAGSKRMVIFDPRDAKYLYPYSATSKAPHISRVNLDCASEGEFPLLKRLVGYEAIVGKGDILYMPPGWWHQVWTLEDSISVNFWMFRWQTAFQPWFLRYFPFMATQYKRHQKVQGRANPGCKMKEPA